MILVNEPEFAGLQLSSFAPHHADFVCRWVRTEDDLRFLAPSADWPLTADKVIGWKQNGGRNLVLTSASLDEPPIAYGELNPMRNEVGHYWMGHVIVRPEERGKGVGTTFARMLCRYGFERLKAIRISLIVFPDNHPAHSCYRAAGFNPTGDEYHYCAVSGVKERLLRMELNRPAQMSH